MRSIFGARSIGAVLAGSLIFASPFPTSAEEFPDCVTRPVVFRDYSFLIFFDRASSSLTDRARLILDELSRDYQDHHGYILVVNGYTDTAESDQGDRDLGARRAKSAMDYLTGTGIPADDIFIRDYGTSHQLVPTTTNIPEPQNRRVDFRMAGSEADSDRAKRDDCGAWLRARFCDTTTDSDTATACRKALSVTLGH